MSLKLYVPLPDAQINMPNCIPFLYPFFRDFTAEEKIQKYGEWILKVSIVNTAADCDVIVLPYKIDYYYTSHKNAFLKEIDNISVTNNKLIICATKGDFEITPGFKNFHVYRYGGRLSKNKGRSFVYPVFLGDPLPEYFNNNLTFHTTKTAKPVIGFCGQASDSLVKWVKDIGSGVKKRLLKIIGKWPYDTEPVISTTNIRAQLLNTLEKSSLVTTNFIRNRQYRAGVKSKEEKAENSRKFFNNIKESQYIVCYRGLGNFSVRLYETMASGRIPIIVMSDNNLPFPDEIDWSMFPIVPENKLKDIATIVTDFHSALTDEQFLTLQQKARFIWENYFTYKTFMARWVAKYINLLKPE